MPAKSVGEATVFYDRMYVGCYLAQGYWHAVAGSEDLTVPEAVDTSRDPDLAVAHALRTLADKYEARARENKVRAALAEVEGENAWPVRG